MGSWQPPYGTAAPVQNKVTDELPRMCCENVLSLPRPGHACGKDFSRCAKHLVRASRLSWQKSDWRDMKAFP